MADAKIEGPAQIEAGTRLQFHYIKSRHFRVIHVDGAYGGLTAKGQIHLALFNERGAIPRITEVTIQEDGSPSDETRVEGREGVVRELEVDVMVDEKTAEQIAHWLLQKVELLRSMKNDGTMK